MLMQFLKGLIAIVCAVISVAAVQAGAYANGKSKPTPRPSPKSTQPQIKVTTTEGKAEGNFSFLTRSARKGGPREQDWVGSRSGNKKISEKERREALLECFARTNDVTCLDDDPTLQDPWPLTGPVARATSAPPGAARDGGHRWIRTKLTRCVSSSPELRRLPYQPWRPWRDHGTS